MTREDSLALLRVFCLAHSPSGHEAEIDPLILAEFEGRGFEPATDAAGNIYIVRPGHGDGRIVVCAHKDEIGVIVKRIEYDGKLQVRQVGGSYPWIWGEGPMDVLGDDAIVPGVLSFGARHTSSESPAHAARSAPLTWEMAWIETMRSPDALDAAGVHVGSKAVVARSRKDPILMGEHIAGYGLDDKAAMVILFEVLDQLEDHQTERELVVAITKEEETGAVGASWLARSMPADIMLAIEVAPVADEYHTVCDERPVVLMQDAWNLYDERIARELGTAATNLNMGLQHACLSGFGSDASITGKYGLTARPACVGFATENTHGYEIAHAGSFLNCGRLIAEWLRQYG